MSAKHMTDEESRAVCCAMCADFMTSQGRSETAVYWQALMVAERFALSPHANFDQKDD